MRLALLIGWKDCLVRFQSRAVLIFVIVLPLAMTVVTGMAFKGLEPIKGAKVALVIEDGLNALPLAVTEALKQLESSERNGSQPNDSDQRVRLEVIKDLNAKQAKAGVENGELDGAIILPKGFAEAFVAREATVELVVHKQGTLEKSIVNVAFDRLVEILRQGGKPTIAISVTHSPVGEGGTSLVGFNTWDQAVPGNGLMFILLNCMTAGGIAIVRERRQNTLARMLISPASRITILSGKTLGVYFVGLVQAIVVFGFGAFFGVFRNGASSVLGVTLITLLVILAGCAIGMTISALCNREETAESVGVPLALVLTALGGGMFPVELAPQWMKTISFCLPTGWAMDAYHKVIGGAPVTDIWSHLLVLAAFSAVFLTIGVWKLRWE